MKTKTTTLRTMARWANNNLVRYACRETLIDTGWLVHGAWIMKTNDKQKEQLLKWLTPSEMRIMSYRVHIEPFLIKGDLDVEFGETWHLDKLDFNPDCFGSSMMEARIDGGRMLHADGDVVGFFNKAFPKAEVGFERLGTTWNWTGGSFKWCVNGEVVAVLVDRKVT
jgi:hypothetical protein